MKNTIKYMTIEDIKQRWPSDILAACVVDKISLHGQQIAEKSRKTEAEKRRAFEISRYRSLLLQYQR